MGLREYQRKRDFRKTAEPRGAPGASRKKGAPRFVVQKHDASRLHYDFRLEHEGTLKSWAVPKGPSLDPKERRLAVEVEDHPLDYGGFEGTIPQGEYGGGTVLLWDRGTWHPDDDPRAGLRAGRLKFRLDGEKLRGGWTLVRMADKPGRPAGKPNWLLIKEKDEEARAGAARDILDERPESVKSGRDLPAIAAGGRPSSSKTSAAAAPPAKVAKTATKTPGARGRAARSAVPEVPAPQLATLVSEVPAGEGWLHEIKLDGYRILAGVAGGEASLWTRGGKDWADRFPAVARAVAALPVETAILDGEVVALLEDGRSSFQALQQALSESASAELAFFVFDLLYLDGVDWSGRPLLERKAALRKLLPARSGGRAAQLLRFNDHVGGDGADFYRQACAHGLEGIIAKRASNPYRPGRSSDWLKIKCSRRQEFVIGGFTEPSGSRTGLGALLLGVYQDDQLRYAGRVGTGFGTATLRTLRAGLEPLETERPAFSNPPRGAQARGVHWVRPERVAEVTFTEWTEDGLLRHPTFEGLREDKTARNVIREELADAAKSAAPEPKKAASRRTGGNAGQKPPGGRGGKTPQPDGSAEPVRAGVRLSNPDRVLWPEQGLTKLDLAEYYHQIADWILPHVARRPLTLVRCPQGRGKHCFFQKHIKEAAPGLLPVDILEDSGATVQYIQLEEITGVIALVQMGTLEIHGWGSRVEDVERPDRLVFDLDPDPSVPWAQVVAAARLCRERLEELELRSFVQTTGGKGLHVVVPLGRRQTWDEAKPFARAFAASIEREAPERFLTKASKAARKGKIFLDWLRNGRGATAILAYSSRAREGAPVATPVAWEELDNVQPTSFTVTSVPARLAKLRKDPWADFWTVRQSLRQEIRKKLGVL